MAENGNVTRSLALTPTWSVATVLTVFVAVSLLVERSIHRLSNWLRKTDRKPLLEAVEKMKEELMLLGFISLLLTATSSIISNICIPSKFYDSVFAPCTKSEVDEEVESNASQDRKLLTSFARTHSFRRMLNELNQNTCKEGYEPFVSYQGLEQLHRFIFVMAVTHVSYSCLTMLLAIVKIHGWRAWEDEAQMDRHDSLVEITREMTMRRQSTFVKFHTSNPLVKNSFLIWVDDDCPTPTRIKERGRVRQLFNYALAFILIFVQDKLFPFIVNFDDFVIKLLNLLSFFLSIISYVTHNPIYIYTKSIRKSFLVPVKRISFRISDPKKSIQVVPRSGGYSVPRSSSGSAYRVDPRSRHVSSGNLGIQWFALTTLHFNHNLTSKYDFHSYMIRSMEEEFQRIVGVSGPLWGFVVAFMLFNIKGSNLYFWIAIIPVTLVLLVGAKLQHIIATLALESAAITGYYSGAKLKPRDDLFWFKKPELLLSLIHFILFQNAFELASFFWFWWQFGYSSCFIRNHILVYLRLILGFAGQFLCSYSTLPLYALVTQMGTNYKAALIPQRIRETIHGWKKAARRRKRRLSIFTDDSTIHTDTSTVMSLEEDDHQLLDSPRTTHITGPEIELQPHTITITTSPSPIAANETSSRVGTPLLQPSASVSSTVASSIFQPEVITRSSSMPVRRY